MSELLERVLAALEETGYDTSILRNEFAVLMMDEMIYQKGDDTQCQIQ